MIFQLIWICPLEDQCGNCCLSDCANLLILFLCIIFRHAMRSGHAPPLRESLSSDLAQLVQHMLHPDPDRRPTAWVVLRMAARRRRRSSDMSVSPDLLGDGDETNRSIAHLVTLSTQFPRRLQWKRMILAGDLTLLLYLKMYVLFLCCFQYPSAAFFAR